MFDTCNGGLRVNPKFNGFLLVEYQIATNNTLALDNFRERIDIAINRMKSLKDLSYDDIDYAGSLVSTKIN